MSEKALANAVSTRSIYRRLLLPIYVPTLLSSVSLQALLVLVPLYALDKGAGAPFAAFLIGLRGVGMLLFDMPVGILLARIGDKPVLIAGLVAMTTSTAMFALSDSFWVMGVAAVVSGAGFTAWMIGRQSYITDCSQIGERGRAIAGMAGTMRIGGLIGPVVGAMIAKEFGFGYAFFALTTSVGCATLMVIAFTHNVRPERQPGNNHISSIKGIIGTHSRVMITAGFASLALQLLRSGRIILIPLFGHFLGLNIAQIGLIISLAAMIDALLFYPVGMVMDRYGRKWMSVPCLVLSAVSLAALPLTQGFYTLLAAAMLAGFANGLGTGSLLTLGSDLAPPEFRSEFLGIWRFIGDLGHAGGPLMIGVLIKLATLAAAATAASGVGLAGAAVMYWLVDETLRREKRPE
jgi:MFS family permease